MSENATAVEATEEKVNRRDQVKELIAEAKYTKVQIAEMIGVNTSSVSTQMTYLRWMKHNIKFDENKILSFCTDEEFAEWEATRAAKRKTPAGKARTPEDNAKITFKAIVKQEAQLVAWDKKLVILASGLAENPEDEDLQELNDEANANIVLLKIKIKRNKARALELPAYVPTAADEEDEVGGEGDTDESDDNEIL